MEHDGIALANPEVADARPEFIGAVRMKPMGPADARVVKQPPEAVPVTARQSIEDGLQHDLSQSRSRIRWDQAIPIARPSREG